MHFFRFFFLVYVIFLLHNSSSHWRRVDSSVPLIKCILWFSWSLYNVLSGVHYLTQTVAQYSTNECTSATTDVLSVRTTMPVSFRTILFRLLIFGLNSLLLKPLCYGRCKNISSRNNIIIISTYAIFPLSGNFLEKKTIKRTNAGSSTNLCIRTWTSQYYYVIRTNTHTYDIQHRT